MLQSLWLSGNTSQGDFASLFLLLKLDLMIRPFNLKKWNQELQDVHGHGVLLAGVVITAATVIIIAVIIASYSGYIFALYPDALVENSARIEAVANQVGGFGAPVFQLLFTYLLAWWVVRRVGTAVNLHGILIGVMGGIGILVQIGIFTREPVQVLNPIALLYAFTIPCVAGYLGARRGNVFLLNQAQLYNASQTIQQANTPQSIVNGIGKHLAKRHIVHVGLWEILLQDGQGVPTAVSLSASWGNFNESIDEINQHLTQSHLPKLDEFAENAPFVLIVDPERMTETAVWDLLHIRSILLIPLVAPSGHWVGLLTIGSRANNGFSNDLKQAYETIGAQVALVLDNLRMVAQSRETAVLQERQRMAREIHDTLAQGFTSIVMHLEAAEQSLPTDVQTVQHHLDQARDAARMSLGQARRVVDDLRPEVLESAPLHEAIERVVTTWERQSGITAVFETIGLIENLHPELEVTFLRGAQESLANVRKHAQATEVQVTLSYLKDVVILDVADNGVGMSEEIDPHGEKREERREKRDEFGVYSDGGFGLVAMNERVADLGGEVTIDSEPNEGTTVAISIPLVNGNDGK